MGGDEERADAESLIRRAYRAFAERDLESLEALADDGVEVSTITGLLAGHGEPYRGPEGLGQYIEDLASTWKRIELQPQTFQALDADRTLVFGRVRAWHERGFIDSANAWLWTLRDGRVLRVQVFAEPAEAMRLIPDPD